MSESSTLPTPTRRRSQLIVAGLLAVLVPVGATVLLSFPPTDYHYYPRCVFHALTGLHCPGCGGTRSVYFLLRGDLPQAFAYNAVFILALPFLAVSGCNGLVRWWTGRPLFRGRLPAWAGWTILGVMLGFAILRNIDAYPFSLLAPHAL